MTFSCSRSICHSCGLGLALHKQPTQSHHTSHHWLTSQSLTMYNREGYLYTHYMCLPARVQHAYNDKRLHNTKLHNTMVNTPRSELTTRAVQIKSMLEFVFVTSRNRRFFMKYNVLKSWTLYAASLWKHRSVCFCLNSIPLLNSSRNNNSIDDVSKLLRYQQIGLNLATLLYHLWTRQTQTCMCV